MATNGDSSRFEAIVLGAGPAGEVLATRLGERGIRSALVEAELVGGECAYWACIPSKTLLRPGEVRCEADRAPGTTKPALRWKEIAEYRDYMIRNLDDSAEIESYGKRGVSVVRGTGRLAGPGRVEVDGRVLESERILIATGRETEVPSIPGLAEAGYWTNREATTFEEPPRSAAILGGGPVGIELAQLLRRLGAEVHLVETADRLLAREDERVSELILDAIVAEDVEVHLGAEVQSVSAADGSRSLHLADGATIRARELIVAAGRRPRIDGLSLETVGIEPGARGIEIDERCRAAEGIWAVGDVTGVMPFTHLAKYQARVAFADLTGEAVRADYAAVPRVVFSDPELAAVGLTAERACAEGINAVTSTVELSKTIARPWTYETNPRGELGVIADRERKVLVGAWAVGPLAGEWIHYAALAIKAQIPLAVLRDAVPQFPTYTEAYVSAVEKLELS
jgi:pyruvate/2-oxoglutarate dehydrogenase complex dihydrolipoamide dehydrogenase (E3) component